MKRILAILLSALMLACVFVACDQNESTPEQPTAVPTLEQPTESPTETPTEEATTDDNKPKMEEVYVDCWDPINIRRSDMKLEKDLSVGVSFTLTTGYLSEVSITTASYNDNLGSLTMKIFVWDTDFDTTVAKEPVHQEQFVDFEDNETLTVYCEEGKLGADTYLVLVCDGIDEEGQGVGVWCNSTIVDEDLAEQYAHYNIKSFINGTENKKKKIGEFSFGHVYLEDQE